VFSSSGIFSDTHVLALMYAGELAYWHWKIQQQQQQQQHNSFSESPNRAQDILTRCKYYLTRYIGTVKGPLQGQGWDTIKAEQYLKELQWNWLIRRSFYLFFIKNFENQTLKISQGDLFLLTWLYANCILHRQLSYFTMTSWFV